MRCDFCFRQCEIPEGKTGWCAVRRCRNGKLEPVQGKSLAALALDPVEKKPLEHFLPGSMTLSLAQCGCSFDCDFCQNAEIAKAKVAGGKTEPQELLSYALRHRIPSLSYTYTEPLVWQGYMAECAELAHEAGLRNIMVTNGGFSKAALRRLLPLVDAYNIDLKGDEDFYRDICHACLSPVLDGIEAVVSHGTHLEVTTMLIEGIHDEAMVQRLGTMLRERGVRVWHLTRFFPRRRMAGRKATGEDCLDRLFHVALECGIEHVYKGNTSRPAPMRCPGCGTVIERNAFDGLCPKCGRQIYGIWA